MTDTLLETRRLSKKFGEFSALRNVQLDLSDGQVKGIMGPNGAGKSTLLKVISGELGITSGSISFKGRSIADLSADRVNGLGISYVPQAPSGFPTLTVEENIRGAVQTSILLNRWRDKETVKSLLELVGLEKKAGVLWPELPFGEKRLLDIAMALATKPSLLLADEPTAGVDPDESQRVVELLVRLSSTRSEDEFSLNGLIFTEHDREVLFDYSDELCFIRAGEIVLEGTPDELKDHRVVEEYLAEHLGLDERGCDCPAVT